MNIGCTGKARFTTMARAEKAAKGFGLAAYYCRACGGIHVGNRMGPKSTQGRKNAGHRKKHEVEA